MTKTYLVSQHDYAFILGRSGSLCSPSGFPLQLRQALAMGLMVAGSSFRRSLCRFLCPKAPAFAVFPLQSLTQSNTGKPRIEMLLNLHILSSDQIFLFINYLLGCSFR